MKDKLRIQSSHSWLYAMGGLLFMILIAVFIIRQEKAYLPDSERTVIVGQVLEPPHLDPTAGSAAAIGEIVHANIFEGLTRINAQGEVLPGLAESWLISSDGLVHLFNIRKDVLFHDGQLLTVHDIKDSLENIIAPKSINPQKHLFQMISDVEILDETRIIIRLEKPSNRFLFNLGLPAAVIVSHDRQIDNKTNPVGTGPFIFSRWSRGDRIELKRNSAYWGDEAFLERVVFRFIPDPTAALAGLLSGDIDIFPSYPAPETLIRIERDSRLLYSVGATQGKTILAINNERPFLNDIRVRRALAHAVDRSIVIRDSQNNVALPIGSHFSPMEKGYVDLTGLYPPDMEKAKSLMAEAGAEALSLRLVVPPPAYARRSSEVVAYQLEKTGIRISIEQVEWAEWLSRVFHGKDYDLTIVAHVEPFDLDIYARDNYYFGYHSAHYQEIYQKLASEQNVNEQIRLIEEAQITIADDCVNVFLFLLPKISVWNKDIDGVWKDAPIPANVMSEIRWKEKTNP